MAQSVNMHKRLFMLRLAGYRAGYTHTPLGYLGKLNQTDLDEVRKGIRQGREYREANNTSRYAEYGYYLLADYLYRRFFGNNRQRYPLHLIR